MEVRQLPFQPREDLDTIVAGTGDAEMPAEVADLWPDI